MAQINIDIKSLAIIIAIIGLAWSAFLALHRKGNQAANRYLALLIGILTIFILRRSATLESDSPLLYLYFISHSLVFLIGPSVYLHIRTLIGHDSRQSMVHFIPMGIMLVFTSVLYFRRAEVTAIQDVFWPRVVALSLIGIQVIHILSYLLFTRKLIRSYQKACEIHLSSTPNFNLIWSKKLLLVISVLGAATLLLSLLIITGGYYSINNTADTLFLLTVIFIIASLVVKSWNHPEVIYGQLESLEKYKHSPLSDQDIDQFKNTLEHALKEEIYLKPDLTLQELAQAINTRPYLLSQVLNDRYQQNFFSFINQHRVSYAKLKIEEGFLDNKTVEALAYAAGFNSKSTFNRAFRKQEGLSPREFLRNMQ